MKIEASYLYEGYLWIELLAFGFAVIATLTIFCFDESSRDLTCKVNLSFVSGWIWLSGESRNVASLSGWKEVR